MWEAKHRLECKDPTRYVVVRVRMGVEDQGGDILDADPSDGEVVHSNCEDCHAVAKWVD
ncbi:hypothetical protein ES708_29632 [subsurface metagenome]